MGPGVPAEVVLKGERLTAFLTFVVGPLAAAAVALVILVGCQTLAPGG